MFQDLALWGPAIDVGHDYYRLVTAGFLHSGLLHIGFNMYILYWLGTMLEPALGHPRFVALYFASLLAGSAGALVFSPNAVTVGASGAVFGLMGAAFVMQRARGIDPMQSGIGPVILFNLVLSFVIPNISIGGHIGGLVGGAAAGADPLDRQRRDRPADQPADVAADRDVEVREQERQREVEEDHRPEARPPRVDAPRALEHERRRHQAEHRARRPDRQPVR